MFRKTKDFLIDWAYESEATLNIIKNINNDVLSKKENENVRSITKNAQFNFACIAFLH